MCRQAGRSPSDLSECQRHSSTELRRDGRFSRTYKFIPAQFLPSASLPWRTSVPVLTALTAERDTALSALTAFWSCRPEGLV